MAAEQDSLPVGRLFVIGFSGIVITYIIVLLVQGLYFAGEREQWEEKVVAIPVEEADQTLSAQAESNRSYGVVDSEAGTYQIPVERAMELMLEEQGN
ncbi:MAG: hypothetical protein ACYSWX_00385 [Planctomycetota bacterium]|jgi:hypothetical protein